MLDADVNDGILFCFVVQYAYGGVFVSTAEKEK